MANCDSQADLASGHCFCGRFGCICLGGGQRGAFSFSSGSILNNTSETGFVDEKPGASGDPAA